jgi:hypothetical protein
MQDTAYRHAILPSYLLSKTVDTSILRLPTKLFRPKQTLFLHNYYPYDETSTTAVMQSAFVQLTIINNGIEAESTFS